MRFFYCGSKGAEADSIVHVKPTKILSIDALPLSEITEREKNTNITLAPPPKIAIPQRVHEGGLLLTLVLLLLLGEGWPGPLCLLRGTQGAVVHPSSWPSVIGDGEH